MDSVHFTLGALFSFLYGTVIGSFLNVCIYRLPRNESLAHPPSHCPNCNTRLRVRDLVPLFSFLLLRCRCRYCKTRITWRYFIVEFITGLLFLACWWSLALRFPEQLWSGAGVLLLIALCAWAAAMLVTFVIDLETTYVIVPVTLVAMLAGLAFEVTWKLATGQGIGIWGIPYLPAAVPGMVIGFLFFIGIDWFGRLIFRKPGMGAGDSFIGAAIGALLGPIEALLSFGMAIVLGAVIGIVLMIIGRLVRSTAPGAEEERVKAPAAVQDAAPAGKGKKKRKGKRAAAAAPAEPAEDDLPQGYYMPFGPFLTAAAVAVALAPEWFVEMVKVFWVWWLTLYS